MINAGDSRIATRMRTTCGPFPVIHEWLRRANGIVARVPRRFRRFRLAPTMPIRSPTTGAFCDRLRRRARQRRSAGPARGATTRMHIAPAPSLHPRDDTRRVRPLRADAAHRQRRILAVERVGYLVPAADFDGAVHSVFARACNIAWAGLAADAGGPGSRRRPDDAAPWARRALRSARAVPCRRPCRCRRGAIVQARGATLHLADASIWRPAPPRPRVPAIADRGQPADRRRRAPHATAARHSSVIDREGGDGAGRAGECLPRARRGARIAARSSA